MPEIKSAQSALSAVNLRLDFCTHEAAKYAGEHWYYRMEMPRGKLVRIGVWEAEKFCGTVIFGMGSSTDLGKRWGLTCFECCEMVRVAFGKHVAPVSRIVAIAMKLLKRQSPGLRAVVSFSDPAAGHVGTIYQAMNWVYTGRTNSRKEFFDRNGKQIHSRWVSPKGWKIWRGQRLKCPTPAKCVVKIVPGKHRYVYPLDEAMRAKLQPLAIAYPKKNSRDEKSEEANAIRDRVGQTRPAGSRAG